MSWQDSFVPMDAPQPPVPQAVQAQGWQSSFVPANQESTAPEKSYDVPSAFMQTIKDMPSDLLNPIGNIGQMVYGSDKPNALIGPSKPVITDKVGETAGNIASLLMPFMAVPKAGEQEVAPSIDSSSPSPPPQVESQKTITPKAGDIELIKQKLDLAGITPEQYADALMKSSPNDFAGELGGDPLRMQTQAQAKITGPVMQPARDAMRERLANALSRTQGIVSDALGSPENITDNLATIQQYRTVEPDLYKAVNGMVPTEQFSGILNTPAGQSALAATKENLSNQRIDLSSAGFTKEGGLGEHVPVSTMHEFTKALNGQIGRDAFGNVTDPAAAFPLQGMSKDVVSQLKKADPNFELAQDVAAQARQAQQAFDNARQTARMTTGDKAEGILEPLSQNPFAVSGYHQGLLDKLSDTPLQGGNPAGTIAKQSLIERVGNLTGDTGKAQALADALMQEKGRVELAQRGLYGSNTAETLSAGAVPNIPTSPEGIINHTAGKVMDYLNAGKNERIAQLLYATSPEQKKILADALRGSK
jgi:hypothetical protein